MPRVTRRSLTSKKEDDPEQAKATPAGSRGKRGAKSTEAVEEPMPAEVPTPTRGGRSSKGKEETPKANSTRTTSRGRGKKDEEPEEKTEVEVPQKRGRGGRGLKDQEEDTKEKDVPIPKRGGRGGRGEVEEEKATPAKRSRDGKGKTEEKEDEEEAPPAKRPARGGRGGKKEEDKLEETPPPKRAGRVGRGKKEEEIETNEEDSETISPEKPAKRGGRSARGKKEEAVETNEEETETASPEKPAKRGGRSGRGKKEEAVETNEEESETASPEKPAKRGGRSGRGKKEVETTEEDSETVSPIKPAAKGRGRASRGSHSGKQTEVAEVDDEAITKETVTDEEPVTVPKGRQSRTPKKPEEAATPPASGGRRGRGKKEEVTPKTTPTRPSRRAVSKTEEDESVEAAHKPTETEELTREDGDKDEAIKEATVAVEDEKGDDLEQEEKKEIEMSEHEEKKIEQDESEPSGKKESEISELEKKELSEEKVEKEVEQDLSKEVEKQSSEEMEDATPLVEEMEVAADSNKKRPRDEDEEDSSSKKARVSDSTEKGAPIVTNRTEECVDMDDFVIISKDDVPASDSKEVEDALPPSVDEQPAVVKDAPAEVAPVDVPKTEEEIPASDNAEEPSNMERPIVVPLTEAELAKQYNPTIRDRDENSSMMVEVGSEAASDVGNVSRVFDMSDASGVVDQTGQDAPSESSSTEITPSSKLADTNTTTVSALPTPDQLPTPAPVVQMTQSTESKEMAESSPMKTTESTVEESAPSSNTVSAIPLPNDTTPTPAQSQTTVSPTLIQSAPVAPLPQSAPASQRSPPVQQPPVTVPELQLNSIPLPPEASMRNSSSSAPSSTLSSHPSIPPPTQQNTTAQNGNCQPNGQVSKSTPLLTSTPAKKPFVLDSSYVPSSPSITKRKFISNASFPIDLMDPAFCFNVVSYNLLADCHLKRYDYSYTESQYLELTHRHSLFMKELEYLDGDIVCLQEVGSKYFNDMLQPAMKSQGYQGVFRKRTQDWYDEGAATFIKMSKFEMLSYEGLSLKDLAYEEIKAAGLTGDVARAAKQYLDRPEVVLVCKLLSKKTGKHLTVGNIHVAYTPKNPDIQCIQVASAVKELVSKAGSDLNPYIICGDFNSETTSPAYQLAKDGYLSDEHIRILQSIQAMDNTEGSSRSIIHHLWKAFQHTSSNMKSAYEVSVGKEPTITSKNSLFTAGIDYIFFSSSTLYTVGALEVIDPQVVEATGGLPSKDIPSDHLSMKAVFRLKD